MKSSTNIVEVFKPINLNITIESKEELAYLWGLFNTSHTQVLRNCSGYADIQACAEKASKGIDIQVFRIIDNIVKLYPLVFLP